MNIRKARQEGLRSLSEEDLAEKLEKTIICKLKAKASDSPIQAPEGTLEMWEDPEQHAQKQDDQDPSPVDSKATDTQELRICGFPVLWSRKHTTIFRCPRNA